MVLKKVRGFFSQLFRKRHDSSSEVKVEKGETHLSGSETFMQIQHKLERARQNGESIVPYVKAQIRLLESSHEEFLKQAVGEGYPLSHPRLCKIEIEQYSAMIQLAENAGLDTKKYNDKIKEIRIRVFGKANYKRFYEDPDSVLLSTERRTIRL